MESGSAAILLIGLAIYFLPAMIASNRKHQSSAGVFLFNLLLGWTLLGWVLALVWAASGPAGHKQSAQISGTMQAASLPPSPPPIGAAPLAPRVAMPCPSCGGGVPQRAKFCPNCGVGLDWGPA